MARTLDITFTTLKNRKTNQPLFLYTIYEYDGTKNLNLVKYESDVVYKGVTYSSFPISHETIGENNSGEIQSVTVTLANVSRLLQAYLENYDLRSKKVLIRRVWADMLLDSDAYSDDIYYIDNYTADQNNVSFTLTSKFDVLDLELPRRKFSRNYCAWKFKSTECGYSGSEITCDKTLRRCRELSNSTRYGGTPAVPSKRIFGAW